MIWESEKRNTHGLPSAPAALQNFFKSSFHSTVVYDFEMAIWNDSMPMMNAASLDSDCRPEPPTPTASRCAPGCLSTRQIRATCSAA